MIFSIVLLIIALLSSIFLTWIVKLVLSKKNIIDVPNERSSHTTPTPRGGGIAITIVWFIGLFILFIFNKIENNLFYALLTGLILVIIGIIDDIYDLKPIIRIAGQFISSITALFFIGGLKVFDLGFYQFNNLWLLSPIAVVGIIWFINLYNFLDGIDGYAAMQAIFLSLGFFYFTNSNFYLLLTAGTLGFILWNWQPAKIFMGDVGSTLLGFNFAIFSIYEQNIGNIPLVVFLIISSLFWFDASLTLLRRFRNNEILSQAHRKHAYQRIVQSGFSHQKTTLFAFGINLLLFLFAVLTFNYQQFMLVTLLISMILLLLITKKIDQKKRFD
jgi:UDP-N-acetylmuramyl pentapeptide phosphotransferase/UDP-N-acetylglucosamine-1-phosphate transferase